MASGYVSWTTPDGNTPNPVYIDDRNKSVEFSAREDVAPYTITRPVGSAIYTLSNLGVINGVQCYRYIVFTEATTTTTTTTTEPPEITLSTTGTCFGGALEGSGRVVASGVSGGSGTYSTIRIGTSMENAFDADPIPLSGAPSYTFDNLNSAVWFVLVTDSAGYQGYARQIINCTNTTTTVAPTSTTTQASTTTTTSTSTTSTSTTTTTGAPISFNLAYDPSSGTTACSNYPDTNTAIRYAYYTATLGNGIQLFTSNALTTPVPNGYYSNGTNYWLASGGASILNSQRSCIDPCGFNGGTAVWLAPPTTSTTTAAPTTTTTTTTAAPTTTTTSGGGAPTTTTAAPTTTTAAPTTTTAAPTTTTAAPSYFYYNAEYCGTALSAGVVRFSVDQVAFSVFETGTAYVCVRLIDIVFGPTYDIDLGDGSSYVGSSCTYCPGPPTTSPPVTYEYYDYEPCTGPGAYSGASRTLEVPVGSSPACVFFSGDTWSQAGLGAYAGPPNYPLFFGATYSEPCGTCL
jgi:hypothetical protein